METHSRYDSEQGPQRGMPDKRPAQDPIAATGQKITNAAETIRESAPSSGVLRTAADAVANTLESSGSYLAHHDAEAIARDLSTVVRRHPVQSVFIGLGLGVLVGSVLARR